MWSYTWEQERQLTKLQGNSGTWNFTYDASGLHTGRNTLTTQYRYWYNDSGLLLRMGKGSTVYSFTYDPAGRPTEIPWALDCDVHTRLRNTAACIGCYEVILCSDADSIRMQLRKSTVGLRRRI